MAVLSSVVLAVQANACGLEWLVWSSQVKVR